MSGNGDRPILGYIGLGLMGGPMALRLCRAGFDVRVWNRSPGKLTPLVDEGATAMDSAGAVAAAADVVLTCLTDTGAVEAVIFGPGGIAEGVGANGGSGKVLVDLSSMKPDAAKTFAERLRSETGMGWVDAPVSGGVPGATNGTLAVMAGGSEADVEAVRPVMDHLAGRFTRMGPNGAGQSTKLVNQMIVGCTLTVLAEVTRFAEAAGIDATLIPEALAGGRADSLVLQQFLPRMAKKDYAVEGRIDVMLKDLETVQESARGLGAPIPMTATAAELHRLLTNKNHGTEDNAAMARLFDPDDAV